ncbi:MAG TPA: SUMF1/EgtB/PvdO family nonheme iron enzyme [Gemmataceae bacterium]|nr:SUMF1/EgtB/PvdO family nonheme iron enzyme [Gemmataceae bacterium]
MKRSRQHPLRWCLFSLSLAAALGLLAGVRLDGQPGAKLPTVEKATHKNYTEELPNKVKFDMVAIPGGSYLMGSPSGEPGRQPEEGQHPVTIRPFWMGKCEVTWDEYDLYRKEAAVGKNEENDKRLKANADAVTGPTPPYADETFGHCPDGRSGYPALCITHHAAMEYCHWLSKKTGKRYRLPTEAEWEWACRAGTMTPYSFGEDASKLEEYAWFDKNADEVSHKVGQKKPNPWGLHDMHGNVAEWCIDQYVKDEYKKFPFDKPSLAPVELPSAKRYPHVARGGSWADKPANLRSAARRGSDKKWLQRDPQRPQSIWWMTDADFVGFRVVRPVEEQDNLTKLRSKITRESPDE